MIKLIGASDGPRENDVSFFFSFMIPSFRVDEDRNGRADVDKRRRRGERSCWSPSRLERKRHQNAIAKREQTPERPETLEPSRRVRTVLSLSYGLTCVQMSFPTRAYFQRNASKSHSFKKSLSYKSLFTRGRRERLERASYVLRQTHLFFVMTRKVKSENNCENI